MIPIGDDNSLRKSTPVVNYVLILINVLVFFLELSAGEQFVMDWSFVPSRFSQNPFGDWFTIFTSMFMHAGFGHLIGNMLYLWIFGDNVEDVLGKFQYIIFYLMAGIAATFSQMFFDPTSSLPHLGASGAIGGVLGAYIYLFPKSNVKVLVGQYMTQMSALIVIGLWFVLQFASGLSSIASTADSGGVAYMAHIGGFVSGFLMAFVYLGIFRRS